MGPWSNWSKYTSQSGVPAETNKTVKTFRDSPSEGVKHFYSEQNEQIVDLELFENRLDKSFFDKLAMARELILQIK